ncbi:uncharacterized protein N7506_010957 [Penicillium brevicompactum]|uniref:uncharacterized protein n=1 Tax=Penicillium brevicompactum TaxID=5074 RepID=UPI0025412825|nr:uncharacterized protein N7506_010957 [Penicillium brevicompactum]KAJ5321827.1 hypothetical protein N7506_010957 [Penicillium brevicompactum]
MSGSSSPAGKAGKSMSSNLLTMKFMRRAAASKDAASKDSQSTSDSSKPHSKRPRLSTDAESACASEMDAITAALAAEEEKRQKAVARAAEEAGETHWVLDMPSTPQYKPQPLVLAADSLDADDDNHSGGRQTFGNFKRKEKPRPAPSTEVDENGDEWMEDPNTGDLVKVSKAQKQKQAEIKLSQLTSISGSGRASLMGAPSSDKKKKKRKSH